jgi:hypothetical protein
VVGGYDPAYKSWSKSANYNGPEGAQVILGVRWDVQISSARMIIESLTIDPFGLVTKRKHQTLEACIEEMGRHFRGKLDARKGHA